MSPRLFLVLMTAIAVLSDSMLHPFYPHYFAQLFGITDSGTVSFYIATCTLTVLVTFPFWAWLARRIPVIDLLIATQWATFTLSLTCAWATSLTSFWVTTVALMAFKSSYLLVYPYVMRLNPESSHLSTISLLALVVYFGNILSAGTGGALVQFSEPHHIFVGMALGDAVQTLLCVWMRGHSGFRSTAPSLAENRTKEAQSFAKLARLGALMSVLYFSAYCADPFFATYWETTAGSDNRLFSGFAYALPGVSALFGLWINSQPRLAATWWTGIAASLIFGIIGLFLQALGIPVLMVMGRLLFGWSIFQAMVQLDVLLFAQSRAQDYAGDFSKANLFQGLGVLGASLCAGQLATNHGPQWLFAVAAFGLMISALLHHCMSRGVAPIENSECRSS